MARTQSASPSNTRNTEKPAKSSRLTKSSRTSSSRSRQRPGAACHECRGRKVLCDRQQPICGACQTSDLTCQYTMVLAPRGPKPGYLKDLRTRLGLSPGPLLSPLDHKLSSTVAWLMPTFSMLTEYLIMLDTEGLTVTYRLDRRCSEPNHPATSTLAVSSIS